MSKFTDMFGGVSKEELAQFELYVKSILRQIEKNKENNPDLYKSNEKSEKGQVIDIICDDGNDFELELEENGHLNDNNL